MSILFAMLVYFLRNYPGLHQTRTHLVVCCVVYRKCSISLHHVYTVCIQYDTKNFCFVVFQRVMTDKTVSILALGLYKDITISLQPRSSTSTCTVGNWNCRKRKRRRRRKKYHGKVCFWYRKWTDDNSVISAGKHSSEAKWN